MRFLAVSLLLSSIAGAAAAQNFASSVAASGREVLIGEPLNQYTPGIVYVYTRGAGSWREAARLLIPICRALQYAHDEDLIHRDIKPSNIILTQSGEPMLDGLISRWIKSSS